MVKRTWKWPEPPGPSRTNHLVFGFPDRYVPIEKAAYKLKLFRQRLDRAGGIVSFHTVPSVGNRKKGTKGEKLHLHTLAEFRELVSNSVMRRHWHEVSGGFLHIEPLHGEADIQRISEYLDDQILPPGVTHDWRSRRDADDPDAPPPNDDDMPARWRRSEPVGGDEPPPNDDEPPAH